MKKLLVVLSVMAMAVCFACAVSACGGGTNGEHVHNLIQHPAEEATCVSEGSKEYYECLDCGKFFADADGEQEIEENSWIIASGAHLNMEHFPYNEATCTAEGNEEYYYCKDCDRYFSDAEGSRELQEGDWVIPIKMHEPVFYPSAEPDCVSGGNIAYFRCDSCGRYFSDEGCTQELGEEDIILPALSHKNMIRHEESAPTCTENGNTAYCECPDCGLYFDAEGLREIEKDSWIIETEGHIPGEVSQKDVIPPTCSEPGKATEVVFCDLCGEVMEEYTVELPPTGHTYSGVYGYDDVNHWKIPTCGHDDALGSVAAHDFENNTCVVCSFSPDYTAGLEYSSYDGTSYAVTGRGQASGNTLVIPSVYNGLPVTRIEDNAFSMQTFFTNIVIPRSVTEIGDYAFYRCSSLTEAVIPESVVKIGGLAFADCTSLKQITLPGSVEEYGGAVFEGCTALQEAKIAASAAGLLPKTIKSVVVTSGERIADYAFENSEIERITLPEGIAYIGNSAFANCVFLTDIDYPASIMSVGDYAFSGCTSLRNLSFPAEATLLGIGAWAFLNCTGIESISLPDGFDEFRPGVFSGCTGLESFDFLENRSIRTIGEQAFSGCVKPTVFKCSSVGEIGYRAFADCVGLARVHVDGTVREVSTEAFEGCYNITSALGNVVLYGGIPKDNLQRAAFTNGSIPDYAFSGCTALEEIVFLGTGSVGTSAFYGCTSLSLIDIRNYIPQIGLRAFAGCTALENLYLDAEEIGAEAFKGCSSLTTLKLGFVEKIGEDAFLGCDSLAAVHAGAIDAATSSYVKPWCEIQGLEHLMNRSVTLYFGEPVTGHIEVPDTVTAIGSYAFYGQPITSVTIPDSVTEIGQNAFSDTQIISASVPVQLAYHIPNAGLQNITLVGSGGIANALFSGCANLQSVTLGAGIESIGSGAFSGCSALSEVHISDLAAWCAVAFGDRDANPLAQAHNLYLGGERVTDLRIPDGVEELSTWVFAGGSFESVTVPNSVSRIAYGAFAGGDVAALSLSFIGERAGDGKVLGHLFADRSTASYSNEFVPQTLRQIAVTGGTALPAGAFANCSSIADITLSADITTIGDYAFSGCADLSGLAIPGGVTSIGAQAFSGCTSLAALTIPAEVTEIKEQTFYGCEQLSELTIPGGVTSIGAQAFSGCASLAALTIPAGVTEIKEQTFYGCAQLSELIIPSGVASIGEQAFAECTSLQEMILPDGVTSIGDGILENCTSLKSAIIGNGIAEISKYTFSKCAALVSVTIGGGVQRIAYGAFSGCNALSEVHIGDLAAWVAVQFDSYNNNPLTTAHNLYLNGEKVVQLIIPQGITEIGQSLAGGSFESIVIPDSVAVIADGAFRDTNITSATIPAFAAEYMPKTLRSAVITSGDSLPASAFSDFASLTKVELPQGLTEIGNYALYGCSSLTSINIPQSVKSIGTHAFLRCTSLTEVSVPDEATHIGFGAFAECGSLRAITLPFVGENADGSGKTYFGHIFGANELNSNGGFVPYRLQTVVLTGGTAITARAFYECYQLTSITLPESLTSIGDGAFDYCYKLAEVYNKSALPIQIGGDEYGAVGYYAKNLYTKQEGSSWFTDTADGYRFLYDGDKGYLLGYFGSQADLTLPEEFNAYNGAVVTEYEIYDYAFIGSDVESVVLSGSVTRIGDRAFSESALETIFIGNGVQKISNTAFIYCESLQTIAVAEGNSAYSSAGNCLIETASKILLKGTNNSVIPAGGSVASIGYMAFSYCRGLTAVTIPDSVTSIASNAFYYCSALETVHIGSNVEEISNLAFYGCEALKNVVIPDSVTSIGMGAFQYCSGLESISLPMANSHFGWMFGADSYSSNASNVPQGLAEVTVTSGLIAEHAFDGCNGIERVVLPDSLTEIGSYAFYNCSALNDIVIGRGVTAVGEKAFYGCNALERLNITDFNAWLQIDFANSSANPLVYAHDMYLSGSLITEIVIPETVIQIKPYSFYGGSFTSVTIPAGLQTVGREAFSDCASLEGVYIGDLEAWCNIDFLYGSGANPLTNARDLYLNGEKITDLVIPQSVTEIKSVSFSGGRFTSVTIHNGVTVMGSSAFAGGSVQKISLPLEPFGNMENGRLSDIFNTTSVPESLQEVVLTNGTVLYSGMFGGCGNLLKITLPDSLTSIGASAFENCESLLSIDIPGTVKSIGMTAFRNCNGITAVVIPASVTQIGERVFEGCGSLENITVAAGNTVYHSDGNCLIETDSKTLIEGSNACVIPSDGSVVHIGRYAFYGRSGLREVAIPQGAVTIGSYAFSDCDNLAKVTIGEDVLIIEAYAFRNCKGLKELVIPDNVTQLYNSAFVGCNRLEKITLPYVVSLAGATWQYHFGGIFGAIDESQNASFVPSSLKLVVITGGSQIGANAFKGCSSITGILLPNSITGIGQSAFEGCSDLTAIFYDGTSEQWENVAIAGGATDNIQIYFFSRQQPADGGNYWHYAEDGITPVIWTKETI